MLESTANASAFWWTSMTRKNKQALTHSAVVRLLSVEQLALLVGRVPLAGQFIQMTSEVQRRTSQSHQTAIHRPVSSIIAIIIIERGIYLKFEGTPRRARTTSL